MTCGEIIDLLENLADPAYAMSWDNPGLQCGRRSTKVDRVYVALDVTDEVIADARKKGCQMIVTHHPLIFGTISKVNDCDFKGRWILELIESGISCYSMHTNFDIAPGCMADLCADRLGLYVERPLEVTGEHDGKPVGIGSVGTMKTRNIMSVRDLADKVKSAFGLPFVTVYTPDMDAAVRKISMCPGSAKGMSAEALAAGADVLIGGDMGHHDGVDSVAGGLTLINAGHYGLEHIFVEFIADYLREKTAGEVETVCAPVKFPEELV